MTGTIYFPPKYKYLGRIIKLDTPSNARTSVRKLEREFEKSSYEKKVRIKNAANLAGNRAKAAQGEEEQTYHRERELEEIHQIYKNAERGFSERL